MPKVKAQNLRACIVCTYLMEQEVIDPIGEVVNGCEIICCWHPDGKITGEACEACVHFANIHKQLSKGSDEHVKKTVETHQEAPSAARTRPGKGQGPNRDRKAQHTPIQLELDPTKVIKT